MTFNEIIKQMELNRPKPKIVSLPPEEGKQDKDNLCPVLPTTYIGSQESVKYAVKGPFVKYIGKQFDPRDESKVLYRLYNLVHSTNPRNKSTITEQTVREIFKKKAEYAPGIPNKDIYQPIPQFQEPKVWEGAIHKHQALRAGLHYDLRLGDPDTGHAYSFALRNLPTNPGDRVLAVEQPTHTISYMDFEGEIPEGYGAGTVQLAFRDQIEVLKSEPGKISFVVHNPQYTERYTLIKAFEGPRDWLLINNTPTRPSRPEIPDFKPKYREIKEHQLDPNDGAYWAPKIDGSHSLFVLRKGKPIDVFSYRVSKRGPQFIDHSYKQPLYKTIASEDAILRGELYGSTNSPIGEEQTLASTTTAGLLNSGTWKSRADQIKQDIKLNHRLYDVVSHRGQNVSNAPYEQKFSILHQIVQSHPILKMVPIFKDPEDKKRLLHSIKSGVNPLTSEGVVRYFPDKPIPEKMKFKGDTEVYITSFFPATKGSKYSGNAVGGFYASIDPNDKMGIIRVGAGLTDELRKDMYDHPEKYIGQPAKVEYQNLLSSGKMRVPIFKEMRKLW